MTIQATGASLLAASCPVPVVETERVLLGHGSGGQLSAELLRDVVLPALGAAAAPGALEDGAVLTLASTEVVMSTDSFVVSPLFFPGGDIGELAVNGTVNDLAAMGAVPIALTLALVIEEGFPIEDLRRICSSIGRAAVAAGVPVVTGDTKVVGRGAADGLFVNTAGLGRRLPGATPSATRAQVGDVVLLSGPLGLHGCTVMCAREGLGFESDIASDTQPLHELVAAMVDAGGSSVHVMRDPTRGGLASSLNEIAASSRVQIALDEDRIPVPETVRSVCEILGLDVLHVANEGCLVAIVARDAADAVLVAMQSVPAGRGAVRVGEVIEGDVVRVVMRTLIGSRRIVDMLIGEQLPRIC